MCRSRFVGEPLKCLSFLYIKTSMIYYIKKFEKMSISEGVDSIKTKCSLTSYNKKTAGNNSGQSHTNSYRNARCLKKTVRIFLRKMETKTLGSEKYFKSGKPMIIKF